MPDTKPEATEEQQGEKSLAAAIGLLTHSPEVADQLKSLVETFKHDQNELSHRCAFMCGFQLGQLYKHVEAGELSQEDWNEIAHDVQLCHWEICAAAAIDFFTTPQIIMPNNKIVYQ